MTEDAGRFRIVAGVVLVHVLVNLVHGVPHVDESIPLAAWQTGFVVVVVIGAPLTGLWLSSRGHNSAGAAAIITGGLGSAVFGTYYHFFSATPDNVARVTGPWSELFLATSVAISVLAVVTAVAGGWLLVHDHQSPDPPSR